MYTPKPIDTKDIVLDDEIIKLSEQLSKKTHEVWAAGRIADGWVYGEKRDDNNRMTPCLVPYEELSEEEKRALRARALLDLPARTARFAKQMGVSYSGVKITSAKKRLGSCNAQRGISYSYRVMQYPEEVIDYVVVHELAHCKEMNHSPRFYAIIARYLPDYKERIRVLRTHPTAM